MSISKGQIHHNNPLDEEVHNKDQFESFLRESDPQNPFGINYVMRTQEEKIYSKFRSMRKYVNLSVEDSEKVVKGNFKHYSQLAFYGTVATIPAFITQFALRKHQNRLSPIFWTSVKTFSAVLGIMNVYTQTYNELVNETYLPLMHQYLPLAIKNGFVDYEISSEIPPLE